MVLDEEIVVILLSSETPVRTGLNSIAWRTSLLVLYRLTVPRDVLISDHAVHSEAEGILEGCLDMFVLVNRTFYKSAPDSTFRLKWCDFV